jgi:hypothetical protein
MNSDNWGLVKACMVAGLYPNLVIPAGLALIGGPSKLGREGEGGGGNLYTEESSDSEVEDGEVAATSNTTVMVDSWITFLARQEVATQVMQLRQKWSSLWMRRLTTTSKQARMQEEQDDAVISTMAALLAMEEAALGLAQPHGFRNCAFEIVGSFSSYPNAECRNEFSALFYSCNVWTVVPNINPPG